MKSFLLFVLSIVISFIPGAIGFVFTPHESNNVWFNMLNNSVLTPAGWVFGVAWTILYLLLGIALFLVIKKFIESQTEEKGKAYWLFFIQMILNAAWSWFFFGLQMPFIAMIILLGLIWVSVCMASVFYRISKPAAILVWPYILWLLFAGYLNSVIVLLN